MTQGNSGMDIISLFNTLGKGLGSINQSQKNQYGYFMHPSGQMFEYQKEKEPLGQSVGNVLSGLVDLYSNGMLGQSSKTNAGFGGTQATQATQATSANFPQNTSYQPFGNYNLNTTQDYQIPNSLQALLGGF